MADTLANKFILALEPVRDQLYTAALGVEGSAAKAEAALQRAVRGLFPEFVKSPGMDVAAAMGKTLGGAAGGGAVATTEFMPADVWARLAAAVQLTAAQVRPEGEGTHALNPDSVLLSPDPLLAPKKPAPFEEDDLPAPSRFFVTSVIAVALGVILSVYILTRPAGRATTQPASAPATMAR
ncbi:MAG: hypothetical protein ACTHN5_16860 [Phycisphaerae bacterium]